MLQPSADMVYPLDTGKEADAAVVARLREVLGDTFAERVAADSAWAREILGMTSNSL